VQTRSWVTMTPGFRTDVILDTSALIAILLQEPEADAMVRAIAADEVRLVGAPTLVEASAVIHSRKGPGGEVALDALLERMDVRVIEMSVPAAKLARLAYARFGKGLGDPGVLNFGDCLSYGVAMAEREPLLFKGDDFGRTDVSAVAY
jgi:ribonuclease VapC